MSRYTTKLQNIMEANIRLEKRLLTEQQQSSDQDYELGTYTATRHFRKDMKDPKTSPDGKNYELEITKFNDEGKYVVAKIKCTNCDFDKGEGMYDNNRLDGSTGYELAPQNIGGKEALSGNLQMGDFMDLTKK